MFTSKDDLDKHNHYLCDTCDKFFSYSRALAFHKKTNHKGIHTNANTNLYKKPKNCVACEKALTRSFNFS